jgi:hypothetical protein
MINVQRIHDEHDAFTDKGLAGVANALAKGST